MSEIGPVVDAAVVEEHDVLKLIAGHVRPTDARIRKIDVGEFAQTSPFKRPGSLPSFILAWMWANTRLLQGKILGLRRGTHVH
jgi:hypothetical protein